jgi:TP901 family phage tail tape measure protein
MRAAGAAAFQRDVEGDAKAVDAVGKAAQRTTSRLTRAGNAMNRMGRATERAGRSLSRNVTRPVGLAGAAAIKLSIDFDRSMRNVNSIAGLPEKQFASLRKSVLALAGPTAQAPDTLAKGLYDLVSSGFSADQSLKILRVSSIAATAGLTDAATSTKVVAASLNAYRLPVSKAQDISDSLFQTVNLGVLSFADLANSIGQVLPYSAALGVDLTQVGGAVTTLTKGGLQPDRAMNRLQNLFNSLIKSRGKLGKTFGKLGFEGGEDAISKLGLQGTMDLLAKQTGGNKKKAAQLFPDMQAMQAFLALTGKNSKAANADLAGMRKSGGMTAKVFREQSKATGFQIQRAIARTKKDLIELGDVMAPALNQILDVFEKGLNAFDKFDSKTKTTIVKVGLITAALGPLAIVFGKIGRGVGALLRLGGKRGSKLGGKLGGLLGERGATPKNPMYVFVVNDVPGLSGLPGGKGKGKVGKLKGLAKKWGPRAGMGALRFAPLVGAGLAWNEFLNRTGAKKGGAHGINPLTGRPYNTGQTPSDRSWGTPNRGRRHAPLPPPRHHYLAPGGNVFETPLPKADREIHIHTHVGRKEIAKVVYNEAMLKKATR